MLVLKLSEHVQAFLDVLNLKVKLLEGKVTASCGTDLSFRVLNSSSGKLLLALLFSCLRLLPLRLQRLMRLQVHRRPVRT